MDNKRRRYTLEDIAKLAGFSPKTISRVINNDRYVKEETRKSAKNYRSNWLLSKYFC
ncbi:MAG: LacI family DNA-binding transcriptional regulator [Actinomycetota bacterium]|nr:LacI family DNA-binding transcriptional regulator [Actinomycetota bacterium]